MKIKASKEINSDAAKLKEYVNIISKNINSLQGYMSVIPQFWKGKDSESFVKKYNTAIVELRKYEKNFNDYYKFLTKVYDIFSTLDEKYGVSINLE